MRLPLIKQSYASKLHRNACSLNNVRVPMADFGRHPQILEDHEFFHLVLLVFNVSRVVKFIRLKIELSLVSKKLIGGPE